MGTEKLKLTAPVIVFVNLGVPSLLRVERDSDSGSALSNTMQSDWI